jgi:2-amino-4-hydroxy-6-hydroxymethyldihydropteridine diphosphokinase
LVKKTAYIGLGSNRGNATLHLREALLALRALPGVETAAASSVYLTEPQGKKEQPWFHNQVVRLDCGESVTAGGLLAGLLAAETRLGRTRDPADRFGPRTIDLDLLLFGQEIHTGGQGLFLPHPRMAERAFVLVPLREIAPGLILPTGQSVSELLLCLPHTVAGNRIFQ